MIYFEHRKNKISELDNVALLNGVEIDLRSSLNSGQIYLAHDPWTKGDLFEEWARKYAELNIKGAIILNTKEDGLEERAIEILEGFGLEQYLFLDTTIPTFVKWLKKGFSRRFFLRISKYEDLASVVKFKGQVDWLWVDCFDREPMDEAVLEEAKKSFKLCLVSPELQGGGENDFERFKPLLNYFDGVCTKKSDHWKALSHGN